MGVEKDRSFIEESYQKLLERGWIKGKCKPSRITGQDIEELEKTYGVSLPALYKEFLMAHELPHSTYDKRLFEINGIIYSEIQEEIEPLWLLLNRVKDISSLAEAIEEFRTIAFDYCKAPLDSYNHLIPIGDWGNGWGPLCIDMNLSKEEPDFNDKETWSIVWFDHEEFDWEDQYLEEDGLIHGTPAAPDFKTLLEWYFRGSLEKEFEDKYNLKLDYEKLTNDDFCDSYWEDCWKTTK